MTDLSAVPSEALSDEISRRNREHWDARHEAARREYELVKRHHDELTAGKVSAIVGAEVTASQFAKLAELFEDYAAELATARPW